ncbi:MAG: T9SS type A sorting domain-containing protein [Fibrobacteria bacterium]
MRTVGIFLLSAASAYSQGAMRKPAAREHVKKLEDGSFAKFTSKLTTVVELNFTMNNGHQPGKKVITDALTRIATNYGGIKVNKFATASDGSVKGTVPEFTVTDLMAGEVIVSNNISSIGSTAIGTAKHSAIQTTIETNGRGYLAFHGSGDEGTNSWPWYTSTLHPMSYKGHENRSAAPVYKHPDMANHVILDSILTAKTVPLAVPNGVNASGAEVITPSPVPTRAMKNEWYRFGRDISTDAAFKDKVTVLLKYDPRALGANDLDAEYKRKGGNMYTYILQVGKGLTSYIPAGHENDELLDPNTGFDGGAGDFDRYVAQSLFFLAGYNQVPCDASCNGLPILDANNLLTGEKYSGSNSVGRAVAINPELAFNAGTLGFSSTFEGKFEARVTDLQGRLIFRKSGVGRVNHEFDTSVLKRGVYFLSVRIGKAQAKVRRYALFSSAH